MMKYGGIIMKRKIVKIHEEKCNGCGICVKACHESAIEIIDGVARLVSDIYCDGLGDCLPGCPTGAIEIIERDALEYDDDAVQKRVKELKTETKKEEVIAPKEERLPCGCPGTMAKTIERKEEPRKLEFAKASTKESSSELQQWPVQLALVNTSAPYLKEAELLIAADCTAYAYGDFHKKFIKGRVTLIGCPKLDDNNYYEEKLTEILLKNTIKSITVVRMEVPCCAGIVKAVKGAMLAAQVIVPYNEVIITTEGNIL